MKVLLRLPLSPYTGYGNDGIGITRSLMKAGADVYLDPAQVQAPLPADLALLLTKAVKAPFDLTIQHVDPMRTRSAPEAQQESGLNIAWTMWEYSNFLNAKGQKKFAKRWQHFDAMIGYDEVSAASIREHYLGPVIVQQGGFEPDTWKPFERDWDAEDFYFAMIGVLSERKDPFVSIRAFLAAQAQDEEFAKHARLSLKTTIPGLHSKMQDAYPNLRIFYDVWPHETIQKFYEAQHVLLAPSRGEGKNLPALEFMSTGGTVIATNWGGHQQWLSPEYAYPLDYELQAINDYPDTFNARASVEHLTKLMLHTFHNRAEVKHKAQLAESIIPQMCSWDDVMDRLMLKLRAVDGGEDLWMKWRMLHANG